MRIVLDTNVLVSGLLNAAGPCGRILDLVVEGDLEICFDARILTEYREVVMRPEFGLPATDVERVLEFLTRLGQSVIPIPLRAELPDADDQPFLEVAASAEAVLVTGNLRHFPVSARGRVIAESPRAFLERMGGGSLAG